MYKWIYGFVFSNKEHFLLYFYIIYFIDIEMIIKKLCQLICINVFMYICIPINLYLC